ncbi:hypothetical protein FJZ26_01875 [Candidatus Parvarchaeota archaeon]|nr:hypothetical protein [Candidatus Parvarchaeota archaeon]
MKFKLTPNLAYFIGLWKGARIAKGIGVRGSRGLVDAFCLCAKQLKLPPTGKVLVSGDSAFFFHSAYKAYFEQVLGRQLEVFKHKNDYSAAFLAGLFDSCGKLDEAGNIMFLHADASDELLLLRLGLKARKSGKSVIIKDQNGLLVQLIGKFSKSLEAEKAPQP